LAQLGHVMNIWLDQDIDIGKVVVITLTTFDICYAALQKYFVQFLDLFQSNYGDFCGLNLWYRLHESINNFLATI
jgi:hypothetical protein